MQAQDFQSFMDTIWNEDPENLYPQFHNAAFTARHRFGAKVTGNSQIDQNPAYIFTFPDGSRSRVFTNGAGGTIFPPRTLFGLVILPPHY